MTLIDYSLGILLFFHWNNTFKTLVIEIRRELFDYNRLSTRSILKVRINFTWLFQKCSFNSNPKTFLFSYFRKYIISDRWIVRHQICCIIYLQSIVKIANIPRLGSIDICDKGRRNYFSAQKSFLFKNKFNSDCFRVHFHL